MNIHKIKIYNFKSIYDPLELDFDNLKGMYKISGRVGAGKSTIGEAILFSLFGTVKGKNFKDLVSWGEKHGYVESWITSNGHDIHITREINSYGQSPITVIIDNEPLNFTNKRDAQIILENEYYDTSKMSIELLCIISFNNFESLATLNQADQRKFLDQILGFYLITEWTDQCKVFKSNNNDIIKTIQQSINNINAQINKLNEISNTEIIDGNINDVKESIKDIKKEALGIKKEYSNKRKLITDKLSSQKEKLSNIKLLGKNKAKEIKLFEKGVCPTCGADIDQSQIDIRKKEKDVLLSLYKDTSQAINVMIKNIQDMDDTYKSINDKYVLSINDKNNLLARLNEQTRRLNINISQIETLKKEIQTKSDKLVTYQNEDALWNELFDVLSIDVRAKILDSFIPILNKNITKFLQRLQQPYIVEFDNNFKCNIKLIGLDDKDTINISSLSTGQLKTVDMIIILGVLDTIMTGKQLNITFLDELFSNLDSELRNNVCEVLKETMQPNSTLFIISHVDINNSFFDGEIEIKLKQEKKFEKHSIISINK